MLVELADLEPNPFRDFAIDPIDPERVNLLAASIQEDGSWGGVVCRRSNGAAEIIAGHHRVRAAQQAGLTEADVHVGDFDDVAAIRVYAVENSTQRGNTGTALAGSIASAVRFLAKAVWIGSISTIVEKPDVPKLRGNLTSDATVFMVDVNYSLHFPARETHIRPLLERLDSDDERIMGIVISHRCPRHRPQPGSCPASLRHAEAGEPGRNHGRHHLSQPDQPA